MRIPSSDVWHAGGVDRPAAVRVLDDLHAAQNRYYGGGDDTALRALLTDDIAWTVPGHNAIAGRYRGLDEVMGYFDRVWREP